ncbi:3-dehydroquinate synthase [Candidatus Woesearchaeota archaeon]|nr:3-dehydroquinate synthase [Candidatus Woesearchaeota archaeon]
MDSINTRIKMKDKEYSIFVGSSLLNELANFIKENHNGKKVAIIIGENTNKLHGNKLKAELKELNPLFIPVHSGESSKSREIKEKIEDKLLDNKFGRDSLIIAVGGGVIGDLAGFTASTFNRGIPIIHVPTTMLAMVDSSIGGKTGINTKHGKNLIGTTYQPNAVFDDMDFLETLPDEEFRNGLAEVIKMSIIMDKDFFEFLESNNKKILSRDKKILEQVIKKNIELKKDVVEKDPFEMNLRQILNFGHTFGHALEAYNSYKIRHGFGVAQGIIVEARISVIVNNLKKDEEERIINMLKSFGFPTSIDRNVDTSKILELMKSDKKSRGNRPRFVLIDEIGKTKSKENNFSFEVEAEVVAKAVEECKN